MIRGLLLCCALAGCGGDIALKHAGESCSASSECANGLLCDLGAKPSVCADKGSLDAAVMMVDGHMVDARPIDARPIDAAPDAPPDAPPD